MRRLMIVDKSTVVRRVAERILSDMGFLVAQADDVNFAYSMCCEEAPNILVIDADMDGVLDFIAKVRAMPNGREIHIFFSLVEADLKTMMRGKRAGANDFLLRPFDRAILNRVFGKLIQSKAA